MYSLQHDVVIVDGMHVGCRLRLGCTCGGGALCKQRNTVKAGRQIAIE
jgi:hypothetical protein